MAENDMMKIFWNARSTRQVVARLGFSIPIIYALGKNAAEKMTWSDPAQAIVCAMLTLTLAIVVTHAPNTNANRSERNLTYILTFAYAWMTLLYTLSATKLYTIPAGYDAFTDMVGTLVFVGAWLAVPAASGERSIPIDRLLVVILAFGIFVSGGIMVALQLQRLPHQPDYEVARQAARLMLNLCNGVTLLGLYSAMRQSWRAPDPIIHAMIMLFGGAQIAASGRDCLSSLTNQCTIDSIQGLTAYAVAWLLLLGKIAFAAYVVFCFAVPAAERQAAEVATT